MGLPLGLGGGLLGQRHIERAARFVALRRAVEALGHERLHALELGARGAHAGVGLGQRRLRRLAARAAQARQARTRLLLGRLGLRQGGLGLVGFELHQQLAGAHARAFVHQHPRHARRHRAAQLHPREALHAGGELQAAQQRPLARLHGIDRGRPGGQPDRPRQQQHQHARDQGTARAQHRHAPAPNRSAPPRPAGGCSPR